MNNSMYRHTVFRQDAEPKNGLVNQIWEKSMSHDLFKPFSVRDLNSCPKTMLEFILSSMDEAVKPKRQK